MTDTQEYYTLLTKVGAAALANGQLANTPVNIIELAVGDGSGTNYIPTDDLTALKNECWRGTITEKSIDPDNPHIILFKAIIPATVGGFFVREIATYAEDGTIIHVGNFPEAYKVAMSSGASSEFPITMRCLFTSTKNIKLEVDPHTAIASQEWSNRQMTQHDLSENAHSALFADIYTQLENTANKNEIPTSLPANGGNADTVGGKPPADFALLAEMNAQLADKANRNEIPASLPANGGNSATVNGHTVDSNVPAGAQFTDTVYTHPENHPASMITGLASVATGGYVTTGQKAGTPVGARSTAEGYATTASGKYSHAEGYSTTATSSYGHAEGSDTTASGDYSSHAEGYRTTASSNYSHAEGCYTTASGQHSHAEGSHTTASGDHSHAEGSHTTANGYSCHAGNFYTISNSYQYAIGRANVEVSGPTSSADMTGSLFVIGNGTMYLSGEDALVDRSNAFRVAIDGSVYGKSAYQSGGADYSEYFEWSDGNLNNEDRRGHFVILDGSKIKFSEIEQDDILGITSSNPCVVGNAYEDEWKGKYLRDVFGTMLTKTTVNPSLTDENGIFHDEVKILSYVLNPDYNPETIYIPRSERKEYATVGTEGQLVVIDDGTCKVKGYCKPKEGGIATHSTERTPYYVMERIDDTHILTYIK